MASKTRCRLMALLVMGLLTAPMASAAPAAPSLLQRIRSLMGLSRKIPVAAGGSRGSSPMAVCLVSPVISLDGQGRATAVLPLPNPTILAAEPLNEMRILRGQQMIWQQRASSTTAIEGPIAWPVEPVQPRDELTLLLRPRRAAGGNFAAVSLQGAPAADQRRAEALVTGLGRRPMAWLEAVEQSLQQRQVALAWSLLLSPQAPRSPELDELRLELRRRGCGA